jgi:hypothetical protein
MATYFEELTEIVDRVEAIIDREGLRTVFTALAWICQGKARTSPTSAHHWRKLGDNMRYGAACCETLEMDHSQTCLTNR